MTIYSLLLLIFLSYSFSVFAQHGLTGALIPPRIVVDSKLVPYAGPLPDKIVTANGEGLLLSKDDAKRTVTKCSEYFRAIDDGYFAFSNADMANESFFIRDCAPQRWFANVKPAMRSYLKDFYFEKNILSQLPPCFIGGDSYYADQVKTGLKEGSSLFGMDKSFKVTKLTPFKVDFEDKNDSHVLQILGFGDFTGSGFEEILSFYTSHSKQGSGRSYSTYIFSKKEGDTILRVANKDNSWCPSNMEAIFKGCSTDRWLELRSQAQKLFSQKKYKESETLLSNFHTQCYTSLGWPQKLWLTSDLMINRFHLTQFDACLSILEKQGLEKASEFDFEKAAKKAILHNKSLCQSRRSIEK